ncbi:CHAT domain-containing protein [Desulfococcaceae bacterium HSG8]|nr:CHAT domain-containing protein [Desulfococcaceae bacterium HSG8]
MNNRHISLVLLIILAISCAADSVWPGTEDAYARQIMRGEEFFHRGDFENAVLAWEQALTQPEAKKDAGVYIDTLMYLSIAYQSLGFHQKALSALRRALPVVKNSDDRYRNTLFLNSLSDLYFSLGDFENVVKYLEKAIAEARLSQNPRILASVLNSSGNIFALDRDYKGAIASYEECLENIKNIKPTPYDLRSKSLINLLRVTFLSKDERNTAILLDEVMTKVRTAPDSYTKASDLISLTLLIQRLARHSEIIAKLYQPVVVSHDLLSEARQIAEALENPRILSSALGYTGQLYEEEGRYPEAIQLTRKALFLAQEGSFPEILYLWEWQMGRLFKAGGDIEKAIKAYHAAINTLTPVCLELLREYRGQEEAFKENVKPVYLGLADLLLKQSEAMKDRESREDKLMEAMYVMERLKAVELQEFFEDECVTAGQKKLTTLDRTPPHTAVLYPISLPDRLVLLLNMPDMIKHVNVSVDSERLKKTVKRFRKRLQSRTSFRFMHDAYTLYDWLIRPVEAELTAMDIHTLLIAPDGSLRLIPFSALHDRDHFLVEKYAIGTIPAITLTDPKPLDMKDAEILLCGLSKGVQNASPLPSVTAELRDIRTIMNGKVVLENEEYVIDNLTSEFEKNKYSIVHMATHGVFGGTPKDSFLLTYDSKLTMDRLEYLIGISRYRKYQVELLTLSACQTALGNDRSALGLAGVALKAGVRSAIATLWFIDDQATSLAIRGFYQQLKKPGVSKVQALQNVQKIFITRPRYRHPMYWAPFLLIGNWM